MTLGRYYSKIKKLFKSGKPENEQPTAPHELKVVASTPPKPRQPFHEFFNPPPKIIIMLHQKTCAADAQNDLPIYEATTGELNCWHAFGANGFLQNLLRKYELDQCRNSAAFNHFKIGFDERKHRATFALDDSRFYAIEFNEKNSAPVDDAEADRVLERISQIRKARSKRRNFCGVMLEYFD